MLPKPYTKFDNNSPVILSRQRMKQGVLILQFNIIYIMRTYIDMLISSENIDFLSFIAINYLMLVTVALQYRNVF